MCGGGIQAGRPRWVMQRQPDLSKVRWWWPQISAALSIVVGPPSAHGSDVVDLGPGCGPVAGGEGAAAVSGQDRQALVLAEQPPGVAVPGHARRSFRALAADADGEDALVGAAPAQRVTGRDERAVAGLGQTRCRVRKDWSDIITITVVAIPPGGGQGPGQAQPGERVEQRVVAPLPGAAAILHPVGLRRGAGEGVEHAEEAFGAFGGQLPAHRRGSVRAVLHGEVACAVTLVRVVQGPVRVEIGVDVQRELVQRPRIERARRRRRARVPPRHRARPAPPPAAPRPPARSPGHARARSPRPACAAATSANTGSNGSPVSARRGPAASAARTRAAASDGCRRSTCRTNAAIDDAPRESGNDRADASAINPCPTAANRRESRSTSRNESSSSASDAASQIRSQQRIDRRVGVGQADRGPAHLDSAAHTIDFRGPEPPDPGYPQPRKQKIQARRNATRGRHPRPSPSPRRCSFSSSKNG